MKRRILAVLLFSLFTVAAVQASNFFQLELANNVSQDTVFDIVGPLANGSVALDAGSSLGVFIGTEMALDFNLKLDVELGFHGGKYLINDYLVNSVSQSVNGNMSYYSYVLMMGIRLKYDWQITDSVSLEPYLIAGLTPVYMYSPSSYFSDTMDTDLGFAGNPSYSFIQSNVWALDYFGVGIDFDLTRAAVEYSGSSKYLFGISIRRFHRAISFDDNVVDTKVGYICLTGTVLF